MTKTNNNLVSSAKVFSENKYAEFSTIFRIPFNNVDPSTIFSGNTDRWKEIFSAWSDVCIKALEARMDACVSMLFRNRNNVVISNKFQVIFKKSNGQLHAFNHPSFQAMEEFKEYLQNGNWKLYKPDQAWVRQLLKALYWVSEEDKQEQGGYGFGQLISCLEEFTLEAMSSDLAEHKTVLRTYKK